MSSYTTIAKLKNDIPITVATYDTVLAEIIDGVSGLFDVLYGETFDQKTAVEYHNGTNSQNGIILNSHPDASISVWDAAEEVLEGTTALVRDTDYFVDTPVTRRILRLDGSGNMTTGGFAAGIRNIKVTYPTRWATIPDDIDRACIEESIRAWKGVNVAGTNDGGSLGVSSRSPETGTGLSFWPEDLMPKTVRLLEAYRRRRDF